LENKKWMFLCALGGVLMIIGSVAGDVTFFQLLLDLASGYLNEATLNIFDLVLRILSWIALGGGITVIIGVIIVMLNHYKLGKFLIGLGAGMGLIGLIIFMVTGFIAGSLVNNLVRVVIDFFSLRGSFGFVGIILTIISRLKLKPSKEESE
jgi:MFS family permease